MLRITTQKTPDIIHFVDEYFNENVISSEFTDVDLQALKDIDEAEVVGENEVRTPFGICDIRNLSTGVKTLICILHFKDKIFNIAGCGSNVTDLLFKIVSTHNINVTTYINFAPVFNNWYENLTIDSTLIENKQQYREWWYNYEEVDL